MKRGFPQGYPQAGAVQSPAVQPRPSMPLQPGSRDAWARWIDPMGPHQALELCRVMACAWDARPWSEEKVTLYSTLLADLDYAAASKAIRHLIRTSKWPPSVAEVVTLHDVVIRRRIQRAEHQADQAAARQLTGPEARDEDGNLVVLQPIRDMICTLKERLSMQTTPQARVSREQTAAERLERRAVLRAQASHLLGR